MSVSNTEPRISIEAGDGIETDYDFQFKITAKTDLKCGKISALGVYSEKDVDVDFTVEFDAEAGTGTVSWIVPPEDDGYSVIEGSEMPNTQGVIFTRAGVTPSRTTKTVADKLTILIQQLSDVLFDRAILRASTLDMIDREPIEVSELPVDRRAMVYERNDADTGWNIVPSTYDPDEQVLLAIAQVVLATAQAVAAAASAVAAAVSAAAALASQVAAAVSAAAALVSETNAAASAAAMVGTSGPIANRPVGGAVRLWYYATDDQQEWMWSPAAGRWFLVG